MKRNLHGWSKYVKDTCISPWWCPYKSTLPVYRTKIQSAQCQRAMSTNWRWYSEEQPSLWGVMQRGIDVDRSPLEYSPRKEDTSQVCHALKDCVPPGCHHCHALPYTSKYLQRTQHDVPHPSVGRQWPNPACLLGVYVSTVYTCMSTAPSMFANAISTKSHRLFLCFKFAQFHILYAIFELLLNVLWFQIWNKTVIVSKEYI